jgi:hypothetical protein
VRKTIVDGLVRDARHEIVGGLLDALSDAENAGKRNSSTEALVRIASVVEKAWLSPTSIEHVHALDDATGAVRAREREMYGALVLKEREVRADASILSQMLADAYLARGRSDEDQQLVERVTPPPFLGTSASRARIFYYSLQHTQDTYGQLVVYLRLNGISLPSVYGPTADEPPFGM